jgi:lipid-A-disaccharide synthase
MGAAGDGIVAGGMLGSVGNERKLRVFVSAGEASGDHYGARIIAELARRKPGTEFSGLGGLEMEAAGQQRVVRAEDVAHMGITEVLRHAPKVWGAYRRLVGSIARERPDVAVLIDFPDVNFRLAKHLKRAGVPVVWFVSPQLWAWKRRRLRWVQERVDRMLVIFPFEEAFYRARGVAAKFVGHPLVLGEVTRVTREAYAAQFGLNASREWIALLPGSRMSEIQNNLKAMVNGGNLLQQWLPGKRLEFVVPLAHTIGTHQEQALQDELAGWLQGMDGLRLTLVRDARTALEQARAAVVASGTATVLALVAGVPFVVVYRVSAMTFRVAKRLVRYPAEIPAPVDAAGNLPVGMVNLVAGRRIVPELLNERFTAEAVARELKVLIEDGPERERMVRDLAGARERLRPDAGIEPIGAVCDAVEEVLKVRTLRV